MRPWVQRIRKNHRTNVTSTGHTEKGIHPQCAYDSEGSNPSLSKRRRYTNVLRASLVLSGAMGSERKEEVRGIWTKAVDDGECGGSGGYRVVVSEGAVFGEKTQSQRCFPFRLMLELEKNLRATKTMSFGGRWMFSWALTWGPTKQAYPDKGWFFRKILPPEILLHLLRTFFFFYSLHSFMVPILLSFLTHFTFSTSSVVGVALSHSPCYICWWISLYFFSQYYRFTIN